MKQYFAFVFLVFMMSCQKYATLVFFPANEIPLLLTGRHCFEGNQLAFSNSGTTVQFTVRAKKITLEMASYSANQKDQRNWFEVIVNGQKIAPIFLEKGDNKIELNLKDEVSEVKLIKSTENFVGKVVIKGIYLKKQDVFVENAPNSVKKILFIGNSITCGYGNMVSLITDPNTGFHAKNQNAYESYAMKTARKLNCMAELCSVSGIGMFRNFDGDSNQTMPKIFDRVFLHQKKSPKWDFSKSKPDLIFINLGTNDYFLESRGNKLNDEKFAKTYREFILKLHQEYPKAVLVCANGPMLNDQWPENKFCFTRLKQQLENLKMTFEKSDITLYTFYFTAQEAPFGEDYHPSLATHEKMANELSAFLIGIGF